MKTTSKILVIATIASSILVSCNATSTSKDGAQTETTQTSEIDVPFTEAQHYFVKNTYKEGQLTNPKISTQEDFDKFFGMAATMGPNGKPTPIDFTKQYVIAVIGNVTDKATTLSVNSLKQKGDTITLHYKQLEGEKQSYTIQPLLLLTVDNKFQGSVKAVKE